MPVNTLAEIETAAEALPPEQKEELFRFLASQFRPGDLQSGKSPRCASRGRSIAGSAARRAAHDAGKRKTNVGRLAMSWLLDVNFILASRWTTHASHSTAKTWIDSITAFHTCAISELGFVRISLSAAYGSSWEETQESLKRLHARPGHRFLADDVDGTASPETSSRDTTDAHLITLARRHGLKLATLDGDLLGKSWAAGIAVNPLLPLKSTTAGA